MNLFKKSLSVLMVLCFMFLTLGLTVKVNAESIPLVSYSKNGNITANFTLITTGLSDKTTYYQDSSGTCTIGAKSSNKLFNITPSKITLKANLGAGTVKDTLANSVYACFIDSNGNNIEGSEKVLTTKITAKDGSDFTIDLDVDKSTDAFGIIIYHTKFSGHNIRYFSFELSYEVSSTPIVTITNPISNIMIGNTATFTATSLNIENPGTVTWSVDDISKATIIAETGVLTPTSTSGLQTVNVIATINDIQSTSCPVKIYPSNVNPISITEAINICDFVGDTETPYVYTIMGTILSVQEIVSPATTSNTYIIKDENNNQITVYKYNHGKNVNDRVCVTGNLIKYDGETPEITNIIYNDLFTVTLDTDNGLANTTITDVISGSKVTLPDEPTKTDYTFLGWYNGADLWNFATNTVTSNVTLKAKWVLNSLADMPGYLNRINAYMSIGYKYNVGAGSSVTDSLTKDTFNITGTSSYNNFTEKTSTSNAKYAGNAAKNSENDIQLRSSNSNSGIVTTVSGGNARKVTVVWGTGNTAGRTLDIYGSNTAYTEAADLYTTEKKGTKLGSIVYGTSVEFPIVGDYEYIGLRSYSGAMYFVSISIDWEGSATYSDVDFRFRCGVDDDIVDVIDGISGAKYGIEVSDGTTTKKYYSTDAFYQNDAIAGIDYVIISLGDVLNNKSRLDTTLTVRAFVEYEEEFYYSTKTKSFSVHSIMQEYIKNKPDTAALIANFKAVLESFGHVFE